MIIPIGLVDDHMIIRTGLKSLIESTEKYKVILQSSDGIDLFDQLEKMDKKPEMLVIDISMPKMDGFAIIERITKEYPYIKTLVFSLFSAEDAMLNAINRGACGYLPKSADPEELITALNSIVKTGFYFTNHSKQQQKASTESIKKLKAFHGKQVLTEKEIQFIRLAATNMTYKEIAVLMKVQPKTVENYRDSLFQKLGINNRAALTLYGIQNGIVHLF